MRLTVAVCGIIGLLCGLADSGQPVRIGPADRNGAVRMPAEQFLKSHSFKSECKMKIIPPDCRIHPKITVIRPESGIDYKTRIYDPYLKKWRQNGAEQGPLHKRWPGLFIKPEQ
ncbi:MAG TPA: hypothetical protein PKV53_10865 [Anaerohalosphaeraceae bacterium]|nr:hypothetical protein [Anaerohalosphaeraceae bacterium]